MAYPLDQLAGTLGGEPAPSATALATIDAGQVLAYAAATNDANPAYVGGRLAPPVFGVVPTWDATIEALDQVVPAAVMPMLLHADQDMRFLRPLHGGQTLSTEAVSYGVRPSRAGTWVIMRVTSVDVDDGEPVLEQLATMFVRGWTELPPSGADRPERSLPKEARANAVAESKMRIDGDQARRYAEASGDRNRIHVDDAFAREVGLPGIILHGMCTMAFCGRAVTDTLAGGDPLRLRRLAVRFSKPVLPGSELVVTLYGADGGAHGSHTDTAASSVFMFEVTSDGDRVIRDGLAEIGT